MSADLQPISDDRARALVRQTLGMSPGTGDSNSLGHALCGESLRAALWTLWNTDEQSVYITRLLNAAARILLPWKMQDKNAGIAMDEQLRLSLQEMEIVGDLTSLPHGRWAPAPLRAVRLHGIDCYLLLGGVPSKLLPAQLRAVIDRSGVARMTRESPTSLCPEIEEMSEHEWLRMSVDNLATWTQSAVDRTNFGPAGDLSFEIYAPEIAVSGTPQYHRWTQQTSKLADKCYLARTGMRRGSTSYSIVRIERGRVAATGTPPLGDGDVRRLMYGLDLLAKKPVHVRVERRNSRMSFKLGSELPRAEHRLFLVIGREQVREDGKYYPRWWDVQSLYAPRACDALRKLGISVEIR